MRRDTVAALFTLGVVLLILLPAHGFLGAQVGGTASQTAPAIGAAQIRCCNPPVQYESFGPTLPATCNTALGANTVSPGFTPFGLGSQAYVTGTNAPGVPGTTDRIYVAMNGPSGACEWVLWLTAP